MSSFFLTFKIKNAGFEIDKMRWCRIHKIFFGIVELKIETFMHNIFVFLIKYIKIYGN